jgi:hypothetical protein
VQEAQGVFLKKNCDASAGENLAGSLPLSFTWGAMGLPLGFKIIIIII